MVTLFLATNPGGASAPSPPVVTDSSGYALFANVRIDRGGYGYTLVAQSGAVTSLSSTAFDAAGFGHAQTVWSRTLFASATLPDGRVLMAGGWGPGALNATDTAVLYDPVTSSFSPTNGTMTTPRSGASATVLPNGKVLIAGGQDASGLYVASAELFDPAAGTFSVTGSMVSSRMLSTATPLADGRVLITGGNISASKGELYDPVAGTFAETVGSTMSIRCFGQTATRLPDGSVLIAGGSDCFGGIAAVEVFSPGTGSFAAVAPMPGPRAYHAAVLLPDGRVLVVGGNSGVASPAYYDDALIYDAGSWSVAPGHMQNPRTSAAAALLPNGQVLVAGGGYGDGSGGYWTTDTADLFNPSTGAFARTGPMTIPRIYLTLTPLENGLVLAFGYSSTADLYYPTNPPYPAAGFEDPGPGTARQLHTATTLANGQVLITGGATSGFSAVNTAEIYNPVTGTLTPTTGTMATRRRQHQAVLLADGRVLIIGGWDGSTFLQNAEIFTPATGLFTVTGSMGSARGYTFTATRLVDGKVLVTGGTSSTVAELWDPALNAFRNAAHFTLMPRVEHAATLLPSGKVMISGGYSSSTEVRETEIFDPGSELFTAGPSMVERRRGHTATALGNGKILFAGGEGSGRAELYDVATNTFGSIASLTTAGRYFHTATLLPNGRVLIAGGGNVYGGGALATTEVFDPYSRLFTAASTMSTTRTQHTATILGFGGKLLLFGGTTASVAPAYDIYRPR
jgi:WD40 repeat protein